MGARLARTGRRRTSSPWALTPGQFSLSRHERDDDERREAEFAYHSNHTKHPVRGLHSSLLNLFVVVVVLVNSFLFSHFPPLVVGCYLFFKWMRTASRTLNWLSQAPPFQSRKIKTKKKKLKRKHCMAYIYMCVAVAIRLREKNNRRCCHLIKALSHSTAFHLMCLFIPIVNPLCL